MNPQKSFGSIVVKVTTAKTALPVEAATVTISQLRNNIVVPYKILLTDNDGMTEEITVETPSKELSLSPGGAAGYVLLNIEVDKEGYFMTNNINVPVFPGVKSIQPVFLIPLTYNNQLAEDGDNIVPDTTNESVTPDL